MASDAKLTLAMLLAAIGPSDHRKGPPRCEPTVDDQTPRDATAVCSRCGRRMNLDDLGGGAPGGPYKPLPVCGKGEVAP